MWIAAQLLPRREALALHCLALEGFATYLPRCRERHVVRGRKIEATPPLFPGYLFIGIEAQWHAARWSPGIVGLIMDGIVPARVPDAIIADIRSRESGALVTLPWRLQPLAGHYVRVTPNGVFRPWLGC
jgi:transcriptional antiterminator RfaH